MDMSAEMMNGKAVSGLDASAVTDWVFDLDNTIYPARSSLFPRVAERMTQFIMAHFDLAEDQAAEMKTRLFRTYGTTMRGLMTEYDMAPDEFLHYVHEIEVTYIVMRRSCNTHAKTTRSQRINYLGLIVTTKNQSTS